MKQWSILLLALAMLLTVAGAEEVFTEEAFLDAGIRGEEFFSEESFFGDAFEAEVTETDAEDAEAEDRSVYLFETEARPTDATKLEPWQNYYIKLEGGLSGKKIILAWKIYQKAVLVPATADAPEHLEYSDEVGISDLAGVKCCIYAVDPWSGIAMETTNDVFDIAKPGKYMYYARLEKVDSATGQELLGNPSEKLTIEVEATEADLKISSLKASINEKRISNLTLPDTKKRLKIVYEFIPHVEFQVNKTDMAYNVTVNCKENNVKKEYKGVYITSEAERNRADVLGVFGFDLSEFSEGMMPWDGEGEYWKEYGFHWILNEGEESPIFTSETKSFKITVQPANYNKAVSKSLTLKLPKYTPVTEKTRPEIREVIQVDATHVMVRWYDAAAAANLVTPTGYTVVCNKSKPFFPVEELTPGFEKGEYVCLMEIEGVKENKDPSKTKSKKMSFSVQGTGYTKSKPTKLTKLKKSKSFKKYIEPGSKFVINDVKLQNEYNYWEDSYDVTVFWKCNNDKTAFFEVYLTDSTHSSEASITTETETVEEEGKDPVEVTKVVIPFVQDETNLHYNPLTGRYWARFSLGEKELTDGYRLGVVIKAMAEDGVTVLGRKSFGEYEDQLYWEIENRNKKVNGEITQVMKEAEYIGGNFDTYDILRIVDSDGGTYGPAKIIKVTKDGTVIFDETDPDPEKQVHDGWINEPGSYTITAGVKDDDFVNDIPFADFTFTVKKRTLDISLVQDNIFLNPEFYNQETGWYEFSKYNLAFTNGDGEDQADKEALRDTAQIVVKDSKGTVIEEIKEAGSYTATVTITADTENTEGLTGTDDPAKGTKTVTLSFTVSGRKLYIYALSRIIDEYGHGYYDYVNAPQIEIGGSVERFKGLQYFVGDVNADPVGDCEVTIAAKKLPATKKEVEKEVELGDIQREAGVYEVVINAAKDEWAPADPVTIRVTIYDRTQYGGAGYSPFDFGDLIIDGDTTQQIAYDGKAKIPVFRTLNEKWDWDIDKYVTTEVTASVGMEIQDSDGNFVDYAIDPGEYRFLIWGDEPGFDSSRAKGFTLTICLPWTLETTTTSAELNLTTATASDLKNAMKFTAKDEAGTEIPEYNGSDPAQKLYFSVYPRTVKDKDGKEVEEIREAGTYTVLVNASVYSSSGIPYMEIEDQEFTVTVTAKAATP